MVKVDIDVSGEASDAELQDKAGGGESNKTHGGGSAFAPLVAFGIGSDAIDLCGSDSEPDDNSPIFFKITAPRTKAVLGSAVARAGTPPVRIPQI